MVIEDLLRASEVIGKRKRDTFLTDHALHDKMAKVRQEEEHRIRASVANEAARSALGNAKYMKWCLAEQAKQQDISGNDAINRATNLQASTEVDSVSTKKMRPTGLITSTENMLSGDALNVVRHNHTTSIISLQDCLNAARHDLIGSSTLTQKILVRFHGSS